jgi:hypothetical protein
MKNNIFQLARKFNQKYVKNAEPYSHHSYDSYEPTDSYDSTLDDMSSFDPSHHESYDASFDDSDWLNQQQLQIQQQEDERLRQQQKDEDERNRKQQEEFINNTNQINEYDDSYLSSSSAYKNQRLLRLASIFYKYSK